MKIILISVSLSAFLLSGLSVESQSTTDTIKSAPKKYQAKAPATRIATQKNAIRW